jgi:hypothetical protein
MITQAASPGDTSPVPEPTAAHRTVPAPPRVAIVHDWFQGFHGAERVVEAMRSDVFGETGADIFTFHAAHVRSRRRSAVRSTTYCRPLRASAGRCRCCISMTPERQIRIRAVPAVQVARRRL